MSRYDYEFPEPICMVCGDRCDTTEVVSQYPCGNYDQLWCYCKKCDIDTFHPGEPIES